MPGAVKRQSRVGADRFHAAAASCPCLGRQLRFLPGTVAFSAASPSPITDNCWWFSFPAKCVCRVANVHYSSNSEWPQLDSGGVVLMKCVFLVIGPVTPVWLSKGQNKSDRIQMFMILCRYQSLKLLILQTNMFTFQISHAKCSIQRLPV